MILSCPSCASVAIGISAARSPTAAIVDVRHASRSGMNMSATSTTSNVATTMSCGASACQSKTGVEIVCAAARIMLETDHLRHAGGRAHDCLIGDVEDDVGEDPEREDQHKDRQPRCPLERVDVVHVR